MWYTGISEKPDLTSDFLANEDEISGKGLRNLDRRVGRVVYRHTEEQKAQLLQNNQQCPKFNGKSEYSNIYSLNRILT